MKKIIVPLILGLVAGAILGVQQVITLTPEMESQVVAQLGSKQVVILIAMFQTAAMTSIAAIIGARVSPKVNLNKPFKCNKKSFLIAIAIGLVSACLIAIPEKLVFAKALGLENKFEFSWIYFLGSILYGGIIEEILLRFGLMSLIIWVASKIKKSKDNNGIYIAGVVISAFLFAIGHLPATATIFGLNTVSVTRTLLLNFFPGIGFGYLYWKHGLVYGMLGHITTHVMNQLILLPLLFNLF